TEVQWAGPLSLAWTFPGSPEEAVMSTVHEILRIKGSEVHSIEPEASALEAAQLMNRHKIGALLVMDGHAPIGIITERDLLQRIIAAGRDPAVTTVAEVMTSETLCCQPQTTIDEAKSVMRDHRIRHLPVVNDDGELCGMISI